MTVVSPLLVSRYKRAGMLYPVRTAMAAKEAALEQSIAASILIQESGGGHNVFGHDPTIFGGAGVVTEAKYRAYKAERRKSGNKLMQGVGPCQLTYYTYQDEADAIGGCWRILCNMRIGFHLLAEHIRKDGLHAGIAAYNGTGPAAEHYADVVIARAKELKAKYGLT